MIDRKYLKNIGYSMIIEYIREYNGWRVLYARMILKYRDEEYYREDLFGDDIYLTDRYYDQMSTQHLRNKKLEEIGI